MTVPRVSPLGVLGALAMMMLCITTTTSALKINQWRPMDSPGLYNESDRIVELYHYDFKCNVYGSERAWLVEFYNTWCGFCQRIAPIYKSMAENVSRWDNLLTIAAIDCAVDENYPICKEYGVQKTPTLKLFRPDSKPGELGVQVKHEDEEILLRHSLVSQLLQEQEEGHLAGWPNLLEFKGSSLEELKKESKDQDVKYHFLILEWSTSDLGVEVILDLQKIHGVEIRRALATNVELLNALEVEEPHPVTVVAVGPGNSRVVLELREPTRDAVQEAIVAYLMDEGLDVVVEKERVIGVGNENKLPCEKAPENFAPVAHLDEVNDFTADVEKALRFSLMREVVFSNEIAGEKLQALKDYLYILNKYLPQVLTNSRIFAESLHERVVNSSKLTGSEFLKMAEKSDELTSPRFRQHDWSTCRGSEPRFRGYPCGVWTLFHTLTVASAQHPEPAKAGELTVLKAMHGYIKNFFGCADCAKHFVEMSARRKLFEVADGDDSVLWLWAAHNEVNKRLAGDESEDPMYKKVVYPTMKDCPACRDARGMFVEHEVLEFLKRHYDPTLLHTTTSLKNVDEEEEVLRAPGA